MFSDNIQMPIANGILNGCQNMSPTLSVNTQRLSACVKSAMLPLPRRASLQRLVSRPASMGRARSPSESADVPDSTVALIGSVTVPLQYFQT